MQQIDNVPVDRSAELHALKNDILTPFHGGDPAIATSSNDLPNRGSSMLLNVDFDPQIHVGGEHQNYLHGADSVDAQTQPQLSATSPPKKVRLPWQLRMALQKGMKKTDGDGPGDVPLEDSEYFEQLDREITLNGARTSLRDVLDKYGLTAEQLDETLQDIKKNQITYTFSKTQSIGGTMHQIMVELYKRAKVEHASWIRERRRAAMVPKLK